MLELPAQLRMRRARRQDPCPVRSKLHEGPKLDAIDICAVVRPFWAGIGVPPSAPTDTPDVCLSQKTLLATKPELYPMSPPGYGTRVSRPFANDSLTLP